MIAARVSLNGQEFGVVVPSDGRDGERLDFTLAVERAVRAQHLAFPADPVYLPTAEVTIRRTNAEPATHDGAGVVSTPSTSDEDEPATHDGVGVVSTPAPPLPKGTPKPAARDGVGVDVNRPWAKARKPKAV